MRVFFRNSLCGIYVQHSQISGHMQENAEKSLLRAGFHQRRVGLILDFAARIEDKSGPGAVGREDNPVILFGDGDADVYKRQGTPSGLPPDSQSPEAGRSPE